MILTDTSICLMLDQQAHTIDSSHPNYNMIRAAIANKDWSILHDLVDVAKAITHWSKGHYTEKDGYIYYKEQRVPVLIEKRILEFMEAEEEFDFLLKFHERLLANPSYRAVNELYAFLEHKNLPIGADGHFYAYKAIKSDWTDMYSGKINNSIGQTPTMPRQDVDDNCGQGCSAGLHVGSLKYVKSFGRYDSVYIIVKVDPADVVSVPLDCNCQKVRTCRYTVVSEYTGPLPEYTYTTSEDKYDEDDEGDEYDEYDEYEEGEECYECGGTHQKHKQKAQVEVSVSYQQDTAPAAIINALKHFSQYRMNQSYYHLSTLYDNH
jgi:hypothetical protein